MSGVAAVHRVKARAGRLADAARARVRRRHELLRQNASKSLQTVLDHELDLELLSYQEQGDERLNTDEAFVQRQRLRRHPAVTKVLEQWWVSILDCTTLARPGATSLEREDYIHVCKMLYRDLLGQSPHTCRTHSVRLYAATLRPLYSHLLSSAMHMQSMLCVSAPCR